MLLQPKNDHLLFAYFGISLQIRRRSMRTDLRSRLTLKRKLVKELGQLRGVNYKPTLIRDPRDDEYPQIRDAQEFVKDPKWRYYEFHGHDITDHVAFKTRKYFAYVDFETQEWDITKECNEATLYYPEIAGLDHNDWDSHGKRQICEAYWDTEIAPDKRGYAIEIGLIPYDRILLCDDLGDHYHEPPHLLVEFGSSGEPFSGYLTWIEGTGSNADRRIWEPDEAKRVSRFPNPLPDKRAERRQKAQTELDDLTKKNRY
jgi:hypothetical protein